MVLLFEYLFALSFFPIRVFNLSLVIWVLQIEVSQRILVEEAVGRNLRNIKSLKDLEGFLVSFIFICISIYLYIIFIS